MARYYSTKDIFRQTRNAPKYWGRVEFLLHHKQQRHLLGAVAVRFWWRRRESNPRPQALYRQFYILSPIVWF